MIEFSSVVAETKTASAYKLAVNSSFDRIDKTEPLVVLRHRRIRHFSDDASAEMVPFDETGPSDAIEGTTENGSSVSKRRHSDSFGIDAYRPLNAIAKLPNDSVLMNGSLPRNGDTDCQSPADTASTHHDASVLNWNSANHTSEKPEIETFPLTTTSAFDAYSDGEFVGEFTPNRAKKDDIELEPLLLEESKDELTSSFAAHDNKGFSRDDCDLKGSPAKRDRKTEQKLVADDDYSTLDASEGSCSILVQVSFPFFIAGCGTVGAGLVLDKVQHHRVFAEVPQIFILVPALLGLKGNLEMTLASRLSTLANLGRMDTKKEKIKQVVGNLALIQAQAAVIAFLAAVFAIILGWIPNGEFRLDHSLLLCAASLVTASLASLILGVIMVGVVLLSKMANINPDNVATPIAASLGDLTTLSLLAAAGSLLINANENGFWLAPFIVAVFILACPLWIWISARNPVTREVLISGWSPVIFSMLISSAGGFILEYTVARYRGIAVFQPVINGIGGNLVAVQASRISTSLHRESRLGVLPPTAPPNCFNPCATFFGKRTHSRAARVLLLLVIPGHLAFMYMIHFLRAGHTPITATFAIIYCSAALIQVSLLLYICVLMVNSMWKQKIDPDNSAIPYLTALGDLLGTALLAIAFHILSAVGDQEMDIDRK